MAKNPASDSIMAPDKMKPLLALSKREPVQAAIGLTSDGDGLILLHKMAKPKKVLAMLRTEAGKAKLSLNNATMRFGRAVVDTDYDPGMVRFFINKDAPGNMRVKLVEVIKRIPYQKVEINVDPSLEQEPEDDGEAPAGTATAAPAANAAPVAETPAAAAVPLDAASLTRDLAALIGRIAQAAGADAGRKAALAGYAGNANAGIKGGDLAAAAAAIARLRDALGAGEPPPSGIAAGPDADALRKRLMALAGRIAQAAGDDAARKAMLAKLASDANAQLKANTPEAAARSIDELEQALDAKPAGVSPGPETAPTATGGDPVGIWWDAKDKVNEQIEELRRVFLATGDELARAACDNGLGAFSGGLLTRFQVAIIDYNQAAGDTRAAKSQLVREAGGALGKFIAGNATLSILEDNPFGVPVTIRRDVLGAVEKIVAGLA